MQVSVTWDQHETRADSMEVPDDTPAGEITRLALELARHGGGGELTSVGEASDVQWVTEDQMRYGALMDGQHGHYTRRQ